MSPPRDGDMPPPPGAAVGEAADGLAKHQDTKPTMKPLAAIECNTAGALIGVRKHEDGKVACDANASGATVAASSSCPCCNDDANAKEAAKIKAAQDNLRWLSDLVSKDFFHQCEVHPHAKKNDCTFFCIRCACKPFCQHCLKFHEGHEVLQIRRYVYHDVVKAQDVQKFFDISGVQTYIINSSRVVFLRDRPVMKQTKTLNACKTCGRATREQFCFCSLRCKVKYCISGGLLPGNWNFTMPPAPKAEKRMRKVTNVQRKRTKAASPTHARKASKHNISSAAYAAASVVEDCPFMLQRSYHRRKQLMPRRSPLPCS